MEDESDAVAGPPTEPTVVPNKNTKSTQDLIIIQLLILNVSLSNHILGPHFIETHF